MTGRKKYKGDLHAQPYDHETAIFDQHKPAPDYDDRDLADTLHEYRTTETDIPVKDQISHGESARGAAERQTYNDGDDRRAHSGASVIDGRLGARNPNVAAAKAVTGQLIQDGGGYSIESDPASAYTEATRFYCAACGEPIKRHAEKPKCEHPLNPCVPESVMNGFRRTGCQACRAWWSAEQGHHRSGRGRQSHTCKPSAEDRAAGRKKSKCAVLWDSEKRRAKREGREPMPAPPRLTDRDRIRMENAIFGAEMKAHSAEAWRQRQADHPDWYWELAAQRRRQAGTTNQFDPRIIPPERRPNGRHHH